MNEPKSKKPAPVHAGFEWAGAVARVRRGGKSTRAGRRAALLGMLTATYANSTRGGRIGDRTGSNAEIGIGMIPESWSPVSVSRPVLELETIR